jgi:hypothetical protein
MSKSGGLLEDPSLVGTREVIPDEQDPNPSVTTYNESFGTSFRGEMLSVSREVIGADSGSTKFSLLWKSPKLVGETRGDAPKKKLRLTTKTIVTAEKQSSSLLQRSLTISNPSIPRRHLMQKVCLFLSSLFSVDLLTFLTDLVAGSFWFS